MGRAEEVRATFRSFRDALFASDVATLDRILAEDYRGYNLRGDLEERETILEAYSPGGVALERFEVAELDVYMSADVGILTGRGHVAGSYAGDPWEHDLRFCDIYVERLGEWRLLISHATPMEPSPR